jgi:hypothetical protein
MGAGRRARWVLAATKLGILPVRSFGVSPLQLTFWSTGSGRQPVQLEQVTSNFPVSLKVKSWASMREWLKHKTSRLSVNQNYAEKTKAV